MVVQYHQRDFHISLHEGIVPPPGEAELSEPCPFRSPAFAISVQFPSGAICLAGAPCWG